MLVIQTISALMLQHQLILMQIARLGTKIALQMVSDAFRRHLNVQILLIQLYVQHQL